MVEGGKHRDGGHVVAHFFACGNRSSFIGEIEYCVCFRGEEGRGQGRRKKERVGGKRARAHRSTDEQSVPIGAPTKGKVVT